MSEYIGTRVSVPGTTRGFGILRYVGPIQNKPGTFGGIELQGPIAVNRGKNSGDVNGIQYFEVSQPMTGLFLPWERLRTANIRLPVLDAPGTRNSSNESQTGSEFMYTPSPKTRDFPLRFSSHSDSLGTIRNGRDSPFSGTQPQHIQNRIYKSNKSVSPEPFHSPSVVGTELGELFNKSRDNETEQMRKELFEMKQTLESNSKEILEKNSILMNLQRTVNELQPLLEEYEKDLEDKDRRISKQRAEYDRAREEWRQSLDLMLSAQQEAESLYEQQIEDLKEEIGHLASRNGIAQEHNSTVEKMTLQIKQLTQEIDRLQDQLTPDQLAPDQPVSQEQEELIEQLQKKVDRLTQDVVSMEFVMEDIQAKSKAKDNRIVELEMKLDEIHESQIDSILSQVDAISVADRKEEEQQLTKRIWELESELKIANALHADTSSKLQELQDQPRPKNSQSKIADLENEIRKNKAAAADKIDVLNGKVQKFKEREEELVQQLQTQESCNGANSLERTVEDLKHELAMRPSFDELTELQTSLEEVDKLHQDELLAKDEQIRKLRSQNDEFTKELAVVQKTLSMKIEQPILTPPQLKNLRSPGGATSPRASTGSGSLPDPETWVKDDILGVYTPKVPIDPSAGRADWCGLCERDGHNSLNCPYENDIF